MKTFILKVWPGQEFTSVAKKAHEIAVERNILVEFTFNERQVFVSANTNLADLHRYYQDSWLMEWRIIGPDCPPYNKVVQAEYDKRKSENEEKNKLARIEGEKRDKEARDKVNAKIAGVEVEFANEELWESGKSKNTDPYGACIYEYAETWAKLMQVEIKVGKSVAECAESTSFEMGYLGITGFMYGAAVSILSAVWGYGEELRIWHNQKYNHKSNGVVNPAVLTVSN